MSKLGPNKPETQSEKAYRILKKMIMNGDIREGEVMSTVMLSEQIGIGRTPLSNACQRLEYDGLVRVIPKQGVLINTLSIDQAVEIYESRATIESFFARKSINFYEQSDIDALSASVARQLDFGRKKDYAGYIAEDTFFHRYGMLKYKNGTLMEMYDRIVDRIFLYGIRSASNEGRVDNAIREHHDIIRCIENMDADAMVRALESHIMNGYIQLTGIYKL
ncbi:MAG: GntR family transcriptional regulator [Oscillospiraceae bacterium]|jgi:DNA-binding GntR family transcriptional regulator|nr:GntR family transcriptional regulator [Oscillospiraceae bacterium]